MLDRRLLMSNSVMEMRLRIAINDNIWTDGDGKRILKRVMGVYLLMNRKRKLDIGIGLSKKRKLETEEETEESSEEEETMPVLFFSNYFKLFSNHNPF